MEVVNKRPALALPGLVLVIGLWCLLPIEFTWAAADAAVGPEVKASAPADDLRALASLSGLKRQVPADTSGDLASPHSSLDASPLPIILHQNFPNPFNPYTDIRFELPEPSQVRLEVYNIIGQRVATLADGWYDAGAHLERWDGNNSGGVPAASGIYFYRLEAGPQVAMRKMVLLR